MCAQWGTSTGLPLVPSSPQPPRMCAQWGTSTGLPLIPSSTQPPRVYSGTSLSGCVHSEGHLQVYPWYHQAPNPQEFTMVHPSLDVCTVRDIYRSTPDTIKHPTPKSLLWYIPLWDVGTVRDIYRSTPDTIKHPTPKSFILWYIPLNVSN